MNKTRYARLREIIGIDFHVAAALLFRCWSVLAGAVMIVTVPSVLGPQQQGYYYTFASLLGVQVFFELGLNQVIVQLVGHEMAYLKWDTEGGIAGERRHFERLQSIVSLLRRWYAAASVLFLLATSIGGEIFFNRTGSLGRSAWLGPWMISVISTSVNLFYSPMLAVMEGCGQVGQVARFRLIQSISGYGLTWVALLAGAGLWSIPIVAVTAGTFTAIWLGKSDNPLRALHAISPIPREFAVNWKKEVLPFQWRIAASWASGYLMFQIFTPLTFANLGPVAAGRLGLALTVFGALVSVGVSWINTKIPAFTAHIARREGEQLDLAYHAVMRRSVPFTVAASVSILVAVSILRLSGSRYSDRISDLPTLLCIAATTIASVVSYGAASYMRAHREEPMLPVSVVAGILILVASYFTSRHGTVLTMAGQAFVTCCISLPWTLILLKRYQLRSLA